MYEAIPSEVIRWLTTIAQEADQRGLSLYIVGGLARDLLLGISLQALANAKRKIDVDLAVQGDAISFAEALQNMAGGRFSKFEEFGTATWSRDLNYQLFPAEF